MHIGIIGGGAAGLTAAWLLSEEHDVVLFEKHDQLGGHAHTLEMEQAGERVAVDMGCEFFSGAMFPTFMRLLSLLGVPLHQYPITATLYTVDNRYVALLPPLRNGRVIWPTLGPRQLGDMAQFGYVLHRAQKLMQAPDPSITLEEFLNDLPLTRAFKQRFMYPFVLAGWCVEPEAFRQFSAYDVLRYYFLHRTSNLTPFILAEVVGGTQTYVKALARRLERATVKVSTAIRCVRRPQSTFLVETENGDQYEFDALILATNAREARQLLSGAEGTEDVRQSLGRIEYFNTTIAVHGDARLMPADRRHWSVVNIRYDGHHSSNTVWKSWHSRVPVFKSWVTYETRLPEPLYGLVTFEHPSVNASYFEAQKQLAAWQGRNQLWLAGMYMHDVDCHESAILSAVNVASRLAPHAARLQQLLDGQTEQLQ